MLNICVSGATGWTGRELVRGVLEAEDMTLASAVARQATGLLLLSYILIS